MRLESPTCAHFCGLVGRLCDWMTDWLAVLGRQVHVHRIDERKSCVHSGWMDAGNATKIYKQFVETHIWLQKDIHFSCLSVHCSVILLGPEITLLYYVLWRRDAAAMMAWHPFHEFILHINARFISSCTLNSYLIIKINNDNNRNLSQFKENAFSSNSFIVMGIIFMGWLRFSVFPTFYI